MWSLSRQSTTSTPSHAQLESLVAQRTIALQTLAEDRRDEHERCKLLVNLSWRRSDENCASFGS